MRGLLVATLFFALHCGAVAKRPEDPGLFLIHPAQGARELSVAQAVRIDRAEGQPFETLAAVELDRHWLRVAALGPLGNRILFLEWDGEQYHEERDPHLPQEFPSKLVLRDLQLSLFPASAIRKVLPADWILLESPRRRVLEHGGKPVIVIDYSADDRWLGTVTFQHLGVGYRLQIRAVESS